MTKIEKIQEAMEQYRLEWRLTNPPPRQRGIRKMDFLQFYLFLPVALLGPLVSAFRTAALLVETAAFQQNPLLVTVEALLGTAFFELGAIVYQVIRLRRKAQEEGQMPRIGTAWIIIGMIITIGAVTTSNFVEVLIAALEKTGTNPIPAAFTALLIGLFIGPGVAVCSVIAGEVVGRFLLELQNELTQITEEYKEAMEKWEKRFFNSWKSARGGKKFLEEYLKGTKEPTQHRSEYSHWTTPHERDAEILRYVKDHDPDRQGLKQNGIIQAVWNGHHEVKSDSTKYKVLDDIAEEGRLEKVGNGRIRLPTGW
jgi:hypothetical protein